MGEAKTLLPGEQCRREKSLKQMALYIAALLPAERLDAHHVLELSADAVDHFILPESALGAPEGPASAPRGSRT